MSELLNRYSLARNGVAIEPDYYLEMVRNMGAAGKKISKCLLVAIVMALLIALSETKFIETITIMNVSIKSTYLLESLAITTIAFLTFKMQALISYCGISSNFINIYAEKIDRNLYESGAYTALEYPTTFYLIDHLFKFTRDKVFAYTTAPFVFGAAIALISPSIYALCHSVSKLHFYAYEVTSFIDYFCNYTIFISASAFSILTILCSYLQFAAGIYSLMKNK